ERAWVSFPFTPEVPDLASGYLRLAVSQFRESFGPHSLAGSCRLRGAGRPRNQVSRSRPRLLPTVQSTPSTPGHDGRFADVRLGDGDGALAGGAGADRHRQQAVDGADLAV